MTIHCSLDLFVTSYVGFHKTGSLL